MESLELMPTRIRITSILKKAIYSGEYKSGEELRLTDIADQLGVSRTPIREAFQTLASEGLITLRMNKGAIVNKIDAKFIRDNFETLNTQDYIDLNQEIHMSIWNAADNEKLKSYLLERPKYRTYQTGGFAAL